jgi:hypothetical protein
MMFGWPHPKSFTITITILTITITILTIKITTNLTTKIPKVRF